MTAIAPEQPFTLIARPTPVPVRLNNGETCAMWADDALGARQWIFNLAYWRAVLTPPQSGRRSARLGLRRDVPGLPP